MTWHSAPALSPIASSHSHLLSVPAGPQLLSDIILTSPVLQEEGGDSGAGPSGSGGGGNQFEFGVDPSMDPELAMVSAGIFSIRPHDSICGLFTSNDRSDIEPTADNAMCLSRPGANQFLYLCRHCDFRSKKSRLDRELPRERQARKHRPSPL